MALFRLRRYKNRRLAQKILQTLKIKLFYLILIVCLEKNPPTRHNNKVKGWSVRYNVERTRERWAYAELEPEERGGAKAGGATPQAEMRLGDSRGRGDDKFS